MDFSTLRQEVKDRGYNFQTDARVNRWVNQAYKELCAYGGLPWPFLETDASGVSPLSIPDLRAVLHVTDSTNKAPIGPADIRDIRVWDPTLIQTGQPVVWWLENTTLKVWPTPSPSATIAVRYLKVPTDLSANSDTPIVPAEYHDIIVDGAVCRAQKDNDGYGAVAATRAEWQRQVDAMVAAFFSRAQDGPGTVFEYEHKDY